MLRDKTYKRVAVINTECNLVPGGPINPRLFRFKKFGNIDHQFTGIALADGVSVTFLSDNDLDTDITFCHIQRRATPK